MSSGRPAGRYVELHCHSAFSLLDGASSPEELVGRARELGHQALALTDHDELGGAVRFAQAAEIAELDGIIGAELTVGGLASAPSATHLVLLAESRAGYGNLSTLITRARMDNPRGSPSVSLETLARHAEGLFALTGCPRGWVPARLAAGDERGARQAAGTLADIFGGRLAVECWDHGLEQERALVGPLVRLAGSLGLPWVVTNDVHYARASGRIVHDVLSCLRHERTLDEMGTRLRPSGEWHLTSAARMLRRWHRDPAGVHATVAVAERCTFRMRDLRPSLPEFPLPPGVTADEHLAALVRQGAAERWGEAGGTEIGRGLLTARLPAAHERQLAHELEIIRRLGLAGYFLIVWDIVRFARREGILCQGRGSAANSAVCYCLGITAVDPIRMELLFERFLSEERQEAPDIDLDFAHRERERVLQYVYARYGREHAAMVCEQITYRGRSAVRDAARVLGFSIEQADRLSALSDRFSARATAEALRAGTEDEAVDSPGSSSGDSSGSSLGASSGDAAGTRSPPGRRYPGEVDPVESAHARRDAEKRAAHTGHAGHAPPHARDTVGDVPMTLDGSDSRILQSGGGPRRLGAAARGQDDVRAIGMTPPDDDGAIVPVGGPPQPPTPSPSPTIRVASTASAASTAPAASTASAASARHIPPAQGKHRPVSAHVVAALGSALVGGTEATRRANEVKAAARTVAGPAAPRGDRQRRSDEKDAKRANGARRLTSADRPTPNAAYEPYGSPSGHVAARQFANHQSAAQRAGFTDPHAPASHNERRNPTTALVPAAESDDTLLARAGLDPTDRRVRALADVVDGLHQAPRHRSIHVGGFVLTREPLRTVVPIEPASMPDRTVIQWEKDDLDPVGLVKIDLLGLGMLTVLQDCLLYIRQQRGLTIDLGRLDMRDPAVYDDLCRADTIGVFQVESRAQMNTLPRLKPRCFYDLVVEVALIRPGPIQGDMVHPYLRRRAGEEVVTYPHPKLEPILKRTLGVPLFQEQGMQVAIACAGFTPGEADNLRRAMGHKRSRERMAEICQRLVTGMARNGIPEETATRIYNQINAFADYGFPESHAASFALLVYASAYLKHYYAPEFTAALLNAQPMGFYAPGTIVEDARRHGVEVLPVDLTRSSWNATLESQAKDDLRATYCLTKARVPERRAISSSTQHAVSLGDREVDDHGAPLLRLGLRSVRGLGSRAQVKLEAALAEGSFVDVGDVVRRSGLDRRSLRHLAEAGAFDAMFPNEPPERRRRAALWAVLDEQRGDAGPLAPRRALDPARPAPLPPMVPVEITEADYRLTGISLNGHPMRHLRPLLEPNGVRTARNLLDTGRDGERTAVAGLVICRQRPGTARGFVFLSLEDETGILNVVVTPRRFEREAVLISTTPLLLVRGVLQVEQRVVNLRGARFRALEANAGAEHARRHDFR